MEIDQKVREGIAKVCSGFSGWAWENQTDYEKRQVYDKADQILALLYELGYRKVVAKELPLIGVDPHHVDSPEDWELGAIEQRTDMRRRLEIEE